MSATGPEAPGRVHNQSADTYYGPLGAVIASTNSTGGVTGGDLTEKFKIDALGNRDSTWAVGNKASEHPDENSPRRQFHDEGRLYMVQSPTVTGYGYRKDITFDGSGNIATTYVNEWDSYTYPTVATLFDSQQNYYDAGDRLRFFRRHIGVGNVSEDTRPGTKGIVEEYRYDALGRRVLVRSIRGSACTATGIECESAIERTIWDGDQILYETRAAVAASATPQTHEGETYKVGYVHAGGIDQPVAVLGLTVSGQPDGISVYPHQNWRGAFEIGSLPAQGSPAVSPGTLTSQCGAGSSGCPAVYFPGAATTIDGANGNVGTSHIWFGSLIANKSDGSGMQYMRNRYYDPSTGKFTQQDPIGLAGGMNLYGFAGGDPVNFSDPFGLCPVPGGGLQCVLSDAVAGASAAASRASSAAAGAWNGFKSWRAANQANCQADIVMCMAPLGVGGMRIPTTRTAFGWTNSPSWNRASRTLSSAPEEGGTTHLSVNGKIPTQAEAEQLITAGGGSVIRAEAGHAPGGRSTHTFDHINYVNRAGQKLTVRVTEVTTPRR